MAISKIQKYKYEKVDIFNATTDGGGRITIPVLYKDIISLVPLSNNLISGFRKPINSNNSTLIYLKGANGTENVPNTDVSIQCRYLVGGKHTFISMVNIRCAT